MPGPDDLVRADPPQATAAELAALSARVAQLERMVAALQPGATIENRHPAPDHRLHAGQTASRSGPTAAQPEPHPIPPPPVDATADSTATPKPLRDQRSAAFEDRLGSQVFNLVGVIAIIVGTSWALKLAIEHGLIGPAARVVLGLVVGAAAIVWSERFRHRSYAAFSYTLKAVGSGILYLVLWAALQIYHLLPAGAALAAMVVVTAWNAWMAWHQEAELLAAYALAGGLATPVLLSTGGDHQTFLFTYLAVIDIATVLLVRSQTWPRLLIPAWLATVAYFIGWYAAYFHPAADRPFDLQSWETCFFITVFFIHFAIVSIRRRQARPDARLSIVVDVLTPLANAAFVGFALYSVFQDSELHVWLAWLMAGLAAVFLALIRVQANRVAAAMHLVAAMVFLTVAIPLKASGHTLTAAWLAEGLVLYWAADQLQSGESGEARRSLVVLAAAALLLGLGSLVAHWWWFGTAHVGFSNANLASAMMAVGVLAGIVWLAVRDRQDQPQSSATAVAALIAADGVALLLAFGVALDNTGPVAFANMRFASALLGLAVLAADCWTGYRLRERWTNRFQTFAYAASATLVLFNLTAILATVREIEALFQASGPEAALERSLAISAFLMLYGATLLAAGFWRRSPLVRWQALLLLIFTIFKVFLYDISGLSQGYRVVSFLALGALLLGVSFAYQKDWLGLKQGSVETAEHGA